MMLDSHPLVRWTIFILVILVIGTVGSTLTALALALFPWAVLPLLLVGYIFGMRWTFKFKPSRIFF